MAIEFSCDACGQRYRVQDDASGKSANCKKCGCIIRVPKIPASAERHEMRGEDQAITSQSGPETPCPYCGMLLPPSAAKCLLCGNYSSADARAKSLKAMSEEPFQSCPYCGMWITVSATRCRYCRYRLKGTNEERQRQDKFKQLMERRALIENQPDREDMLRRWNTEFEMWKQHRVHRVSFLERIMAPVVVLVLFGIPIAWLSCRNKGGVTQPLVHYEDRKQSFFSCDYPQSWTVRELDDAQSRRVQFLGREAEIRVRVTMAQASEVPSSQLTEMAKGKAQELLPRDRATFISERTLEVAATPAYEMEYRQHRPQARCRVVILYANRRLHVLMFAAPSESLFDKWSDKFDQFLASYAVPM